MKKFESFKSIVAPLDIINVDTDAIIPKQFLKSIKRTGFGNNLFDDWRYLDKDIEGSGRKDRKINQDFILNNNIYADSKILLARENFGCGSSREHAPWALLDYGFQVIISSSFADIFTSNSFKNGLLLITLDKVSIETLFDQTKNDDNLHLSVNLIDQKVFNDDISIDFKVDEFKKKCLIEGLDEIGLTLQQSKVIKEFEKNYYKRYPWLI
jgi:3-isopropylmalate/(R)-2-methylmalate dehydratase small subunit